MNLTMTRSRALARLCGALLLLSLSALTLPDPLISQPRVETREIATGLAVPWGMECGRDGELWITEHPGMIGRLDLSTGRLHRMRDLRGFVLEAAEAGMLSLALDTIGGETAVYVAYTRRLDDSVVLCIQRFRYDASVDSLVEPVTIVDSLRGEYYRNGCRLLLAPDRTLFFTLGDAARPQRAQDTGLANGRVLRIGLDGSVPSDNPFASRPWPASLTWSFGHRNPQGLCFGPGGALYESEHGEDDEDELNLIERGANYGWPRVHGWCDDTINGAPAPGEISFCDSMSVVEPLRAWTPTIGPCGLLWYDDPAIPPLRGSLLLATLGKGRPELPPGSYGVVQIHLDDSGRPTGEERVWFHKEFGRIRSICKGPDGTLYICTSNRDGRASAGFPVEGDDRIIQVYYNSAGIARPTPALDGLVHPQPMIDRATISLNETLGPGRVRLYDAAGRLLREEPFAGGSRHLLARGELAGGTYIARVDDGRTSLAVRIEVR